MINRKKFIKQAAFAAGAVLAGPSVAQAAEYVSPVKLTILHTNDTHSRLEPFPMDGGRNQGLGGVAARAELIQQIRAEESQVLLLDAGDIFQGHLILIYIKASLKLKLCLLCNMMLALLAIMILMLEWKIWQHNFRGMQLSYVGF
jgi:2',3'-cyclic-nucleotide 2'-phosphodiesterase (5'-nucleotidase family)